MIRALLALLFTVLPALAADPRVEVVSFGFDGSVRRGRPIPLVVRIVTDAAFRGELVLDGGPVKRAFPLDLPAHSERELRATFSFYATPAVSWTAGSASGVLELAAKEPDPGAVLVAVEKEATGKRANKYMMDFPPGSKFFFVDPAGNDVAAVLAACDAVILKDRGTDRASFLTGLPGSAAFRARQGAVLWADGPNREWEGALETGDDISWGEDVFSVFNRPKWTESPRPYLRRVFGFALAPVILAALAAALLPLGPRARLACAAAILVLGAVLAPLGAPRSTAIAETFAVEFGRGRSFDRLEVTAITSPVAGSHQFTVPDGPEPEPVFFSARDASQLPTTFLRTDTGFLAKPSPMIARATTAFARRSSRTDSGFLAFDRDRVVNESSRDLHSAVVMVDNRFAWIGDLPAGASATFADLRPLTELRGRLGNTPRRRMFEWWWRRSDHAGTVLIGFADEEPATDGEAATRVGHGVMVVNERNP